MKNRYFFCLLISFISISAISQNSNHVLEFTFRNKTFNSLRIATMNILDKDESIFVYGDSIAPYTWRFELPDNIWQGVTHLVLGNADKQNKTYEYVHFLYKPEGTDPDAKLQTFKYGWTWTTDIIVPDWTDMKIHATYLYTDTIHENDVTLISHYFETDYSGINVKAWFQFNQFSSFFTEQSTDSLRTYESYLNEYRQASLKYPDSRLLVIEMCRNINKYHTPEDARSVYENFSERNKKSPYGQKIETVIDLLGKTFENMTLRNILDNRHENIIQDSSKYNLLCFTASWCIPCREEIPVLKKIYNDMRDKSFELIYISIDDSVSIPTFQKQIIRDSIPWRVLSAYPFVQDFFNRYVFNGVPTNMLVYPNHSIEFIDVRNNEQREKLYSLCKGF